MDLEEFIDKNILYLQKEEIIQIIGPDQEKFNELLSLSFSRRMPVCWRAAWLLDYMSEVDPWLAENHIETMWNEIPGQHPVGVTRSIIRLLTRYDIPKQHQGIATDLCLEWLTKESIPVAIKAHSMMIILKVARIYPELAPEFKAVLEEQSPNNSVGFKARAKQIIKELDKLG